MSRNWNCIQSNCTRTLYELGTPMVPVIGPCIVTLTGGWIQECASVPVLPATCPLYGWNSARISPDHTASTVFDIVTSVSPSSRNAAPIEVVSR